jgi:hypothetical protein
MRIAKNLVMLAAALIAGIVVGVGTALLTDASSCRGLCEIFLEQRFAAWESVLLGAGASAAVLAAELALSSDLRSFSLRWIRWLNQDVTLGKRLR